MAATIVSTPTIGTVGNLFMEEATQAKEAALGYPDGSQGREALMSLSRAIGRTGVKFHEATRFGGSRKSLRRLLEGIILLYKWGEDPADSHEEGEKVQARHEVLVARLALKRLDEVEAIGRK